MKKLLLLALILLLCSCSLTLVHAPKSVCNHGSENFTEITGSDLKDNQASQTSQGAFGAPEWIKSLFGF